MFQSEQVLRYGGGGGTSLSAVALLVVLLAGIFIFVAKEKLVVFPLLTTSVFLPLSQQVVVAGLHFTMFRILLIFAWLRILMQPHPNRPKLRFNALDWMIVAWSLCSAVAFVLLWGAWGAVVDRLGFLYNVFGLYFLFRVLFCDRENMTRTVRMLAVISAILAVFMLNEKLTGRNFFSVFGGVPEMTYIREGKLRAQGAFAHPILAGTFGATQFALFLGLWPHRPSRPLAALGLAASAAITLCSASSTPLMALAGGVGAFCLWPIRRGMRFLRWVALLAIVALHLAMKAPVWALIGRVDLVGGSSSSHRYELIDQSIRHFGDWWLFGTQQVSSWGFEMSDTSNQYVDIGVTGGALSVALFLGILACAFRYVGLSRRALAVHRLTEIGIWGLGAALFSNTVAFLGISYFDQIIVAWYCLLALIASVTDMAREYSTREKLAASTEVQASDRSRSADLIPIAVRATAFEWGHL